MPACDVWDLVKVPFPYASRPVQQRRPALVVAVPDAGGAPALLWVLMITSADHRGWPGDVLISDLDEAGLPAASIVRPAKIATIEPGDAERIGRLPLADRAQVRKAMRQTRSCLVTMATRQSGIGPAAYTSNTTPCASGSDVP